MHVRTRVAFLALALSSAACSSKITGSVTSKGGSLGTFTVTPTRCESGQHWSFFGVAFFVDGDSGSKIEVVQDPVHGWFVKVNEPGTKNMEVFGDDDCKVLDADVHNTSTRVNDVRIVEGSLTFDCKSAKDGRVKGDLTFTGCD